MDLGIISALLVLIVWGVITFRGDAPGWIHILLTVGMFLLIYRIVIRGTHRGGPRPED